jgi:hypothetical protein
VGKGGVGSLVAGAAKENIMTILKSIASIAIIACSASAFAGVIQTAWDFEQDAGTSNNKGIAGWFPIGSAGFDSGKHHAYRGRGNAWVRGKAGWNAINNWVSVSAPNGAECTASAWLKTSDSLTDGYMNVRVADEEDGSGKMVHEHKLIAARYSGDGDTQGYRLERLNFKMGAVGKVLFYIGLWGNGQDAWIQIDDVAVTCNTPS